MSIYARKYKPSKWEPIIFADKLDDMFTDFAARDFGIKDLKSMVRRKYAIAPLDEEDFDFYFAILSVHKRNVRNHINLLTANVRMANVYPSTELDFKERLEHQNQAIFACVLLSKEMKEINNHRGGMNDIMVTNRINYICISNGFLWPLGFFRKSFR